MEENVNITVDNLNKAYLYVIEESKKEPKLKKTIVSVRYAGINLNFEYNDTLGRKGSWVIKNEDINVIDLV